MRDHSSATPWGRRGGTRGLWPVWLQQRIDTSSTLMHLQIDGILLKYCKQGMLLQTVIFTNYGPQKINNNMQN